jgi:hypothetical protein
MKLESFVIVFNMYKIICLFHRITELLFNCYHHGNSQGRTNWGTCSPGILNLFSIALSETRKFSKHRQF